MNELYHYGIKGMRWGIRRTPEQLGHKKKNNYNSPRNKAQLVTIAAEMTSVTYYDNNDVDRVMDKFDEYIEHPIISRIMNDVNVDDGIQEDIYAMLSDKAEKAVIAEEALKTIDKLKNSKDIIGDLSEDELKEFYKIVNAEREKYLKMTEEPNYDWYRRAAYDETMWY